MTRNHTLVLALFALALLATFAPGPVQASTPDGQTPAVEPICDDQSGAAFGLCNAYCEAMDCHLAWDYNPDTQPRASAVACGKVEDRFYQLTARALECAPGGSDPACPTGTEGCPCGDGELQCEGELFCDEADLVCASEGGGDVF